MERAGSGARLQEAGVLLGGGGKECWAGAGEKSRRFEGVE